MLCAIKSAGGVQCTENPAARLWLGIMPSSSERLLDLRRALEVRMGEMASLLSEVAEALTYYPGELRIRHGEAGSSDMLAPNVSMIIDAREWPSIQEIEQLVANWRELTAMIGGPHDTLTPARRAKG